MAARLRGAAEAEERWTTPHVGTHCLRPFSPDSGSRGLKRTT